MVYDLYNKSGGFFFFVNDSLFFSSPYPFCSCSSPGDGTETPHTLTRKKRRGIIEKRRRDRINTSLSELRRLVPTAYEKQGSAKLEKAEILQLTVDHLKMIHAKGKETEREREKILLYFYNFGAFYRVRTVRRGIRFFVSF